MVNGTSLLWFLAGYTLGIIAIILGIWAYVKLNGFNICPNCGARTTKVDIGQPEGIIETCENCGWEKEQDAGPGTFDWKKEPRDGRKLL